MLSLKNRLFSMLLLILFAVSLMPSHTLISAATDTAAQQFSLKSASKVLYLGGCSGKTASGKSAKYYSRVKIRNLVDGFDKKNYYINLKSSDDSVVYVDDSKDIVYAAGIGKASVTVTVRKKSGKKRVYKGKLSITVMQNADPDTFIVEGITDGQTVYAGDTLKVTLPGTYTDKSVIECEEEGAVITPLADGKSFEITFEEKGDYLITAAAYQSKKYNGFTAYKDFDITVRGSRVEVIQQSADSVLLKGELVDEDIDLTGIMLYEDVEGAYVFRSYASDVMLRNEEEAEIFFFTGFDSERNYRLNYDGIWFDFISESSEPSDVTRFEIVESSISADESVPLTFRYYNASGLDITSAVKDRLDNEVRLYVDPKDISFAYFSGQQLYIVGSDKQISVKAELTIDVTGEDKKELDYSTIISSTPPKGTVFTGNIICSLKHAGDSYLTIGEECINAVPYGDSVVFEALFEMDNGSYKTLNEAGITSILIADKRIALSKGLNKDGGFELVLNNEGKTGLIIYKGEKAVGSFHFEVLPERKPDKLTLEISKDHLNTDPFVNDYVMVKADIMDQYGSVMDGMVFTTEELTGPNPEKKLTIHEMASGRFVINGWECLADTKQSVVNVRVEAAGLSEDFKLYLRDCPYDPADENCTYKLETDGSLIVDNSVGLGKNAPKSTFVTVKISKDGYYVGEGLGYLLRERPIMRNSSEYYGVSPGENFYGILIEHTSEKGIKTIIYDDETCIIPSYMDIEFVPYVKGERLDVGTYDILVYDLKAGDGRMANINLCDKVSLRVVDLDPEIEVTQKSQTYKGEKWDRDVTKCFTFIFEGEDIGKYIKKVDCAESADGTVFVKSVDFLIPNPYFGEFTKTATVERLITKQ